MSVNAQSEEENIYVHTIKALHLTNIQSAVHGAALNLILKATPQYTRII